MKIEELERIANTIRLDVLDEVYAAKSGTSRRQPFGCGYAGGIVFRGDEYTPRRARGGQTGIDLS